MKTKDSIKKFKVLYEELSSELSARGKGITRLQAENKKLKEVVQDILENDDHLARYYTKEGEDNLRKLLNK